MAISYARRVASAMARGFSRSQARGHARKQLGESSITEIKRTARTERRKLSDVIAESARRVLGGRSRTLKSGIEQRTIHYSKSGVTHRIYTIHSSEQFNKVLQNNRGKAYGMQLLIKQKDGRIVPTNVIYIRGQKPSEFKGLTTEFIREAIASYRSTIETGIERITAPVPLEFSAFNVESLGIVFISKS